MKICNVTHPPRNLALGLMAILAFSSPTAKALAPVVREVTSIRQVLPAIRPQTLVIFDLDNTLMEPVQTLGSDQFFSYLVRQGTQSGLSEPVAKEKAIQISAAIQPLSKVRPVEPLMPLLIQQMQRRGQRIFALTARPQPWAPGTLRQVASIGVDFRTTAPDPQVSSGGEMINGVFFLKNGVDKGPALIAFLKQLNLRPSHVIFVDDKVNNVDSVSKALGQANIPHIAFRYGAADGRVKSFDPAIAEIQLNYFRQYRRFLSDEQAERLKPGHSTTPSLRPAM